MTRRATIVLSALALVACTESERLAGDSGLAPGPGDASASPDTGTPPAPGLDSGVGTDDDAGPATVADSGVSTGADSGPAMSASGADPRPGHVGCGDVSCATPEVCCVSLSGQMCQAASSCSGGFSAAGHCDGREDCMGGACCVHFGMFDPMNGAFCRPGGCPSGDSELCHTDADCGSGTCVRCVPPTGGVLDVTYGICSADGRCPSPYTMAP